MPNLTTAQYHALCAKTGIKPAAQEKKVASTDSRIKAIEARFPGLRAINHLNSGGRSRHWRIGANDRREVRARVFNGLVFSHILPPLPVTVRLHRIGKQLVDDFDGLPASLKPVADAVADAYGIKDNDPRITFEKPTQERRKEYEVVIRIFARCEGREADTPTTLFERRASA